MKRSLFLLASTLSATLTAMNVHAATNVPADPGDTSNMAGHMQKQVKPHSHMEEKLGMSVKKADDKTAAVEISARKNNPTFDKSRHFHPRDGGK